MGIYEHQISSPLRVSSSNSISGINVASLCVVSTGPDKGKQNKSVYSTKGSGIEHTLLKQIIQIEHSIVKIPNNKEKL